MAGKIKNEMKTKYLATGHWLYRYFDRICFWLFIAGILAFIVCYNLTVNRFHLETTTIQHWYGLLNSFSHELSAAVIYLLSIFVSKYENRKLFFGIKIFAQDWLILGLFDLHLRYQDVYNLTRNERLMQWGGALFIILLNLYQLWKYQHKRVRQ